MLKFKTKVGVRGQIVIPKQIRESLGIAQNKTVILELQEKTLKMTPLEDRDIVKEWEEIANKEGKKLKGKLIYGDKLYEEIFYSK